MAGYWLKLYTEILDDPKYNRLTDNAKLGMIELMVVAKKVDREGELPSMSDVCFYTRRSEEWWKPVIEELKRIEFIVEQDDENVIRKFKDRQDCANNAERQKAYRENKHKNEFSNASVTNVSRNVTENREDIDKSREEEDTTTSPAYSDLVPSFGEHHPPYIRIISEVTKHVSPPSTDQEKIFSAIDALWPKYPSVDKMVSYLRPYFNDWKQRKTKAGKSYSENNYAWLYDLAVTGEPLKRATKRLPQADCPICHGTGRVASGATSISDPLFGRTVECECVHEVEEVSV